MQRRRRLPRQRPQNLTVVTNAAVTGLVIEGGRAAGVTYRHAGREETARAEAEVILAAGAIGTPQLLMLSGIGPADHLREHGIYVIVDMPAVGANLIDHPSVPVLWSTPAVKGLWESSGTGGFARWKLTHKGPLTSNIAEAGGFARSDPRLSAPDLQWHVLPVAYREQGLTDPARRAMTVLVTLVDVASRGRIRLASRDPQAPAAYRPRLPVRRARPQRARGRRAGWPATTAPPRRWRKICAAELAPGDGVHRPRDARLHPRLGGHPLSPGGHLRDGRRRGEVGERLRQRDRPAAPRPRHRRPARHRRVGHADPAAWQHQRPGDRDRRAGRRPHRRPRPAVPRPGDWPERPPPASRRAGPGAPGTATRAASAGTGGRAAR